MNIKNVICNSFTTMFLQAIAVYVENLSEFMMN